MTNNDLEPCYSCPRGCRIWHDIGGYETVTCQCKNKLAGYCDKCTDPGAVIVIKGASA